MAWLDHDVYSVVTCDHCALCRYLGLYCNSLPAETTARVWDALFNEGPKILFRVALAL